MFVLLAYKPSGSRCSFGLTNSSKVKKILLTRFPDQKDTIVQTIFLELWKTSSSSSKRLRIVVPRESNKKQTRKALNKKKVLSVVCSKPKGRQCPARFFETKRTPSFSLPLGLIADYICCVKGLLVSGGNFICLLLLDIQRLTNLSCSPHLLYLWKAMNQNKG